MRAVFILILTAATAPAATITVRCDQPALVASRSLRVVRVLQAPAKVPPIHRLPTHILQKDPPSFDKEGVCEVTLSEGVYQFHVLAQEGDTLIALTTGDRMIKDDATVTLRTQTAFTPRLRHLGAELPITSFQVRVRGIPLPAEAKRGFWEHEDRRSLVREVTPAAPKLFLSPGHAYPVRILAKRGNTHAALWYDLRSDDKVIDLENHDLRDVSFKWAGDDRSRAGVATAEWVLHLPDHDDHKLPLHDDTRLLTNRHWVESSYGYRTTTGEQLHFVPRARLLPKGASTILWGGDLRPRAYARVLMQWAAPQEAIVWGAYLHNGHGDIVHTFEPKDRHPNNSTPVAQIEWSARLIRQDGEKLPVTPSQETRFGSIPVTKDYVRDHLGDLDTLEKTLAVEVAYRHNGENVAVTLKPSPFVTWRSRRVALEAPRDWAGQAHAYLDKAERIMDYCSQKERVAGLEQLQLFWTNNWGAGWTHTTSAAKHKRMQMSFEDLRRRHSLFDLPDIFVHEMLHAYGYEHGREHDDAIRAIETVYLYHRHALADHPEYEPALVQVVYEVESARNRGDDTFGKFKRLTVR